MNLLALDGTMVAIGVPEKKTPLGVAALLTARRSIAGSIIGGIKETQEMLDFCGSKHNISSDIECIPIQKVNEAYERVVNSDVRYRFVIDNKSLSLVSIKLITSLRTEIDVDGTLDKESSYNDIFDAFKLALKFYHFKDSSTEYSLLNL